MATACCELGDLCCPGATNASARRSGRLLGGSALGLWSALSAAWLSRDPRPSIEELDDRALRELGLDRGEFERTAPDGGAAFRRLMPRL